MSDPRPVREALAEMLMAVDRAGALAEEIRDAAPLAEVRQWAESRRSDLIRLHLEIIRRVALVSVEAGEHIPDRPRVTVTDRGVFQTTPAEILGSRMGREQVEATARLDLTGRGRQEAGGAD